MKLFQNLNFFDHKTDIFFISPHLDDAILSAGGLIYSIKDTKNIKIITVFTKESKKVNGSIEEFVRSCHQISSKKLFLIRKEEDKKVCEHLKIEYLHLGFTDALWRDDFGSTDDIFFKKINSSKNEKDLERSIIDKLKKTIKNEANALIFAPMSIGNHIDHRIINKICRENYKNVIYWEDYPYNLRSDLSEKYVHKNIFSNFEFNKNIMEKERLIKFYKSQISSLFGDKPITVNKERYYFKQDLFIDQ